MLVRHYVEIFVSDPRHEVRITKPASTFKDLGLLELFSFCVNY